MNDISRDNLVFLLEEIRAQAMKSTKPLVFDEVYKRTKIKLRRMYDTAINSERMSRITPVVE